MIRINSLKRIYNFIAVAFVTVVMFSCNSTKSTTTNSGQKGVVFQSKKFEKVLSLAKSQNKPVFLEFYTTWCGPCKLFEREVLSSPEVYQYMNENFINVKIDAEAGEGPALAQRYLVTQYPTMYFLNAKGDILTAKEGMPGGTELLSLGDNALAKLVDNPQ